MKMFLLIILSLLSVFTYSCGGEDSSNQKVECKSDEECTDNKVCDLTTNKCKEKEIVTGVLTSIEVDIDGAANTKEANLLVGEKKTVIAYGIYDNDITETEDLSSRARWYSSDRDVGIAEISSDGQTVKFEAKGVGTTEIYCRYSEFESDHVTFIVSDSVVEKITLSSKIGNSIFLHQAITWDIIATFVGGNQGKLTEDSVVFHSTPEGLSKIENEYRFNNVGTYDVWVSKDSVDSTPISIEVKENNVVNIALNYDRDEGGFIVNVPHDVQVKEIYEGDGENLLTTDEGITWTVKIKTINPEDNTYTLDDPVEGDFSRNGFQFTFTKPLLFHVTVSKVYGEETFESAFEFNVQEAK